VNYPNRRWLESRAGAFVPRGKDNEPAVKRQLIENGRNVEIVMDVEVAAEPANERSSEDMRFRDDAAARQFAAGARRRPPGVSTGRFNRS
jgi:hypothetical protein